MKISKIHFVLLVLFLLVVAPTVTALTKTWSNVAPSYPNTIARSDYPGGINITWGNNATETGTNLSAVYLGKTYSYTLGSFYWTDSSPNPTVYNDSVIYGCNESFRVWYSTDGSSYTATAWSAENATSIDLTSGKYFKPEYRARINASVVGTNYCSFTSLSMDYEGGFSNTLEGLPKTGSNVASFLSNLAPGIGTFVLIISIMLGIGAIVAAIVMVIKGKFMGRMEE